MSTKRGLGKGFGSLLPDDFDNSVMLDRGERVQKILIDNIKPDPNQPRKTFDTESIDELALSIQRHGILQPLVVTQSGDEYIIIAGERRHRAAKKAKLSHVPVLVRSLEELEKLEIGLIENMQRVDLSPIEQALSIAKLNEQFNVALPEIATRLGKAQTTIVNTVRLLKLPDFARTALEKNYISEGHARTVLSLKDQKILQKELVDNIIKQGWSVRQAEAYVKNIKQTSRPTVSKAKVPDQISIKYEKPLQTKLGAKVKISQKRDGGVAQFTFKSNKEFVQFLDRLTKD
jgi:ParB family transcriptional regulator, chromosome partitioning protein